MHPFNDERVQNGAVSANLAWNMKLKMVLRSDMTVSVRSYMRFHISSLHLLKLSAALLRVKMPTFQ
jgi:hypothetical protein